MSTGAPDEAAVSPRSADESAETMLGRPADLIATTEPAAASRRIRRRDVGWFLAGAAPSAGVCWMLIFSGWEVGSKADWFAGLGSFAAVAVALWQSVVIRQQAKQEGVEAADRFQTELKNQRELSRLEVQAAEQRHRAELDAQREIARLQRLHLSEQQQKQALAELSRAINGVGHSLAKLWNKGAKIARLDEADERVEGLDALSAEHALACQTAINEVATAHMLVQHDELHDALDEVNRAIEDALKVEWRLRSAYVRGLQIRSTPQSPSPVVPVQARLQDRMGDAWRLAADLLRTGIVPD